MAEIEEQQAPGEENASPQQSDTQKAKVPSYPMEIEVPGAGHVVLPDGRGVPGQYANQRIWVDESAKVIRIEPLTPAIAPPITPPGEGEKIVQAGDQNEAQLNPVLPEENQAG